MLSIMYVAAAFIAFHVLPVALVLFGVSPWLAAACDIPVLVLLIGAAWRDRRHLRSDDPWWDESSVW